MILPVLGVVVAALYFARDVMMPMTLAVLLSFVLAPLVDTIEAKATLLQKYTVGRLPDLHESYGHRVQLAMPPKPSSPAPQAEAKPVPV